MHPEGIFKVMSGLISFQDCLDKQHSFGQDENLHIPFLLINKDSSDQRTQDLIKLRREGADTNENKNHKWYPFADDSTTAFSVAMVTGVVIQSARMYSPTGIAKSDWVYRICYELAATASRSPHEQSLFGISIPFPRSAAEWIHQKYPGVGYFITRPTTNMTDILRHKVSNVNVGSTEDRLAVQSVKKRI
jgi:hypothetical protein